MEKSYTISELNEILLTKKVEDFYFAITQHKTFISFGIAEMLRRHRRVVTIIDGRLFDIACLSFVDLNDEIILKYDRLSDFYNNENCRPKLFLVNQIGGLADEPAVLLDFDDLTGFKEYAQYVRKYYKNVDLTEEFKSVIGLNGPSRSRVEE